MRYQHSGNKPNFFTLRVKNDSGAAMSAGKLAIYTFDATDDGLAVIRPQDSAVKTNVGPAGILVESIADGVVGEAVAYGIAETIVTINTRAATSDSWTSQAALAVGAVLKADTVNDGLARSAASLAASAFAPAFVLAEAVASQAASATATSLTLTVQTTSVKVFVRLM
jgi:hypothetical protein